MADSSPSFNRFLTALRRKEPDRIPVCEVGIDLEVKEAFMGHSISNLKEDISFWLTAGYDYVALDVDLYTAPQIKRSLLRTMPNTSELFGCSLRNWVAPNSGVIQKWSDIRDFQWPTANEIDYAPLKEVGSYLPSDVKVLVTTGHVYTLAWQLMGFESFCVNLYESPEIVDEVIQRLAKETFALLERVLAFDSVGVVCYQDDIAYTSGLMIAPQTLRKIFFPWLNRVAQLCHSAGRPLIYHSDGKLDSVLTDIVNCGVDALHPIEPKCMNIVKVKQCYGKELALIGNIDLGYTLTRGTTQEVEAAVKFLVNNVAPGGGFLLGSANSITNYVPLKNFKTMLNAVLRYGNYPINHL